MGHLSSHRWVNPPDCAATRRATLWLGRAGHDVTGNSPNREQVQLVGLDSLAAPRPIWWTVARFRPRGAKRGLGWVVRLPWTTRGSYWSGVCDEEKENSNLGLMRRDKGLNLQWTEPLVRVARCFCSSIITCIYYVLFKVVNALRIVVSSD